MIGTACIFAGCHFRTFDYVWHCNNIIYFVSITQFAKYCINQVLHGLTYFNKYYTTTKVTLIGLLNICHKRDNSLSVSNYC